MKHVKIIVDGACAKNPGPGGWACVLRYKEAKKEIYGSEQVTTNNRMELTAALKGLQALKESCEVELITDSEYVQKGMTQWIYYWQRNGWKTKARGEVVNKDLWEQLYEESRKHKIVWTWVRGHAGHEDNERCDYLATHAAFNQIVFKKKQGPEERFIQLTE
jgi:ribonuclease HI